MSALQDTTDQPNAQVPGPASGRSPAASGRATAGSGVWSLVLVGLVAGAVAGSLPGISVLAACALSLATAVAFRPVLAAYLWLAFTPLIVGIDRGVLLPLLRPNEALLLGLLSALAVRWLVLAVLRRAPRPRFTALDGWFAVLALTGSALPLLWTVAQGRSLGLDEFLSAANVAKYYLVFVMVRAAVVSEEQVRRCLWVAMSVGAVVGVIAFLQSMRLFGVPELLATYWAPFGQTQALSRGRGTATIGVAAGTADVMVFCIAIAIGLLLRDPSDRPPAIQPRRPQRLAAELGGAGTT